MRHSILGLLCLLIPAALSIAAHADAVRTGRLRLQFTNRSPLSDTETLSQRTGWAAEGMRKNHIDPDYKLADESFELYVPADYDGKKPFGLLVWVSASPFGGPPDKWLAVLDKRHLIWVGANRAGNDRPAPCRVALAVDAASNAKAKYSIDESRVYVAGGSGGGRVSSVLGVVYSDVLAGGFYMIGCDYFRDIPADEPNRFWQRIYRPPPAKLLDRAKRHSRHVLLTGEHDGNRPQTKGNYERGFRKDGFEFVTYLEVPGMGHELPDAEWFEKGIAFLDERPAVAPRPASQPAAQDDEPDRLLRVARLYLKNGLTDQARQRLKTIVNRYPKSAAAKEAGDLLHQLDQK